MISTVDDLLAYGRALATGKGLLSPAQQDERIDSLVSDVPPLNQPPLKGDYGYGLGLMKEHGGSDTAVRCPVTTLPLLQSGTRRRWRWKPIAISLW